MIDNSNQTIVNKKTNSINSITYSENISNKELVQKLLHIAEHYSSLNQMCAKRLELKNIDEPDLYKVLDASIALQIYAQINKQNDPEKLAIAIHLIKQTFSKLSEV